MESQCMSPITRLLPRRRVILCGISIIGSLLLYEYLQRLVLIKLYTAGIRQSGNTINLFSMSLIVVIANRLAGAVFSFFVLSLCNDTSGLRNKAPLANYLAISTANLFATSCLLEASTKVTFSTKTFAKSSKMVGVMIWGVVLCGKRYGVVGYGVGVLVGMGCTIFQVSGAAGKGAAENSWYGLMMMVGYFGFDGFISAFQEKLFRDYGMSIYEPILYVNLMSSVMASFGFARLGDVWLTLNVIQNHPWIVVGMTLLSMSAVCGQVAITYTIKECGALVFATIMAIRHFLVVFLSTVMIGVIFLRGMSRNQWIGASIVIGALLYNSYHEANQSESDDEESDLLARCEAISTDADTERDES